MGKTGGRLRQMRGHGSKFGRKKEEAIAALLTQRNLEDAARSIGVAPNTLLKWQKLPEFETAYLEARKAAFALRQAGYGPITKWMSSRLEPAPICWDRYVPPGCSTLAISSHRTSTGWFHRRRWSY